jgi:gluconolactonase
MMKIREVASGLQFPEGPVAMEDGSVVLVEIARQTLTRVRQDGSTQVIAQLGGGPNGAAIGPDGAVYVCNNGGFGFVTLPNGLLVPARPADDYSGGRIERVDLATGRVERVLDTVEGYALRGPNDLVFDATGGLYFTDLGKTRRDDMDRGGVFYIHAGMQQSDTVARPAFSANGVGLSPDGQTLYYAETEGARLWAFDLTGPGQIRKAPWPSQQGARMLAQAPGGQFQRFDSLAVDAFGNICVATLNKGGVSTLSPQGELLAFVPMSDPITTNICFGGRDMRTAYVTLSGTGKLVAVEAWPVPGLRLNFNA